MANKILKRTSFGLIRTNPRLSTNVKIVASSSDELFLESIDSNPILSSSLYKGYGVQGYYSQDLFNFFNQGNAIPKNLLYEVYEEDGAISVKDRYKFQRDFTYALGSYPKNSKLYTEEFAAFAPLWLERDNIPDYFIIFRMDGPVTKNINTAEYSGIDKDTDPILDKLIKSPDLFFSNYIQKAKIIAQFDLTGNTNVGSYIRRHVNDPNFPEAPLYFSPEEGDLTYWQGISLDEGGFTRKSEPINTEYVLPDKTIIESEDFITFGFSRNSIVCANLLNMEFLFDDTEQEDYKFYRYFGMYVSEQELGQFTIDPDRLYADRFVENTQSPIPILPNVGDPTLAENQIQTNPKGLKVYPRIITGSTGIYSGRLLTWEETQKPRFGYLKDTLGNVYSIDNNYKWDSEYQNPGTTAKGDTYTDSSFLRVKDTTVNWAAFGGFQEPFKYITTQQNGLNGSANFAFDVLKKPKGKDQIRIKYINPTNSKASTKITTGNTFKALIDQYTIRGNSSLSAGTNDGNEYSTLGTTDQVASSIALAINNITSLITRDPSNFGEEILFEAVSQKSTVVVYYKNTSEIFNNIEFSIFADVLYAEDIPYSSPSSLSEWNQEQYLASPIFTSTGATYNASQMGFVYKYKFVGGNTKPGTRFIIEKDFVDNFLDQTDKTYVKTDKGYSTIVHEYSNYLDSPLYEGANIVGFTGLDKYYVLSITEKTHSLEIGSEGKIPLRKLIKNSVGYLSLMPIRDFDFDFFNTDYNKDGDASLDNLFEWELGEGVLGDGYVAGSYAGATSLLVTTKNAFTNQTLYPIPVGANSPSLRVVFAKSPTGEKGMTGALLNLHEIYTTVDGGDTWNIYQSLPAFDYIDLDWAENDIFMSSSSEEYPTIRKFSVTSTGASQLAIIKLMDYPNFGMRTLSAINEDEVVFAGTRTYPEPAEYPEYFPYQNQNELFFYNRPYGRWTTIGATAIAPITRADLGAEGIQGGIGQFASGDPQATSYQSAYIGSNFGFKLQANLVNPFNFCQFGIPGNTGGGTAGDMPLWSCGDGRFKVGPDIVAYNGLGALLTAQDMSGGGASAEWVFQNISTGATTVAAFGITGSYSDHYNVMDGKPVGALSFFSVGGAGSSASVYLGKDMVLSNYLVSNYNTTRKYVIGRNMWNQNDFATQFGNSLNLVSATFPEFGGIFTATWNQGDDPIYNASFDMPGHSIYIPEQTGCVAAIPTGTNTDSSIWGKATNLDTGLIGPANLTFDYRQMYWDTIPASAPTAGYGYGLPKFDGIDGELYLQTGYAIDAIQSNNFTFRSIYHVWKWSASLSQWRWEDRTLYDNEIAVKTVTFEDKPIWFGVAPLGGIEAVEASGTGNLNTGGTIFSWDEDRGIQVLYYFGGTATVQPRGSLIDDPTNSGFHRLFGCASGGPFSLDLDALYSTALPANFMFPKDNTGQFQANNGSMFTTTSTFGSGILGGISIGSSANPHRLHGVSSAGGIGGQGVVWSYDANLPINVSTSYQVEANFKGATNGANPLYAPFQGPEGFVYGDVYSGSDFGLGALYKIAPIAPTGQVWYGNFDTNYISGLTGSGTIFEDYDGESEFVSISATKSAQFHTVGNTVVALSNYSTGLIGSVGASAGPWIYGTKFIGSTSLSNQYQPMGPTGASVGGTSGGYFYSFNRVKNFPWLGSTANPDYYVVSGQSTFANTSGATSIVISRGITGFSPITDYGIIKPIPTSLNLGSGPAYSTSAHENDFGLLSLWTLTQGGNLLNSVIGTTSVNVAWGSITLPGATNTSPSFGEDLEIFPVDIPDENPFVQWWALTEESRNNVTEAVGAESPFTITGGFQKLIGLYNEYDDTADDITNEYDRLKENDNPTLSVYSRVVPFINKWVYDNESTDVRENGYRLNVDQAFGMFNFTPSFDEYNRNPKLFTHEWYYLQEYPKYMTFDEKRNSFSYFDSAIINPTGPTGDYASYTGITGSSGGGLYSIVDDYFVDYFTRETVDGNPVPRDFRYSIFNGGNDFAFAEALFRGAKVAIKDRSGTSNIDYNVEEIKTVPSAIYDDYKFSAILTYGESTAIKAIKNDKWKTLTVLIEADMNDPLLTNYVGDRWIDRAYLYSANDKYSYVGYGGAFQYADIVIKGSINGWVDTGEYFEIYSGTDINGEQPDFRNDLTLNQEGGFNSVYLANTVGVTTYIYKFGGIFDISTRSFKCTTIEGLPLNPTLTPNGYNSYVNIRNAWPGSVRADYTKPFQPGIGSRIYYEFGGYNAYSNILTGISFASIADAFNSGDPHVQYIQVNDDGTVEFNTFMLSVLPPDDLVKASYLDIATSQDKPSGLQSSVDIGFELIGAPRVELSRMNRYRGEYVPRWYDVIKFVDETDLKEEGLQYLNINIWDVQRGGSGSTASPYYYWKDESLGIIPNLYVYKVNVENPNIVGGQNITVSTRSIYPAIGEISIDHKDFFVFRSNWDPYYYWKYIRRNISQAVIGTREPKEEKAFFGSKVIAIPDSPIIEKFDGGAIDRNDFGRRSTRAKIKTITQDIVFEITNTTAIQKELTLDVYVTSALSKWLISEGFGAEFTKYMDPDYSFDQRTIDDDITKYIEENIFDRYEVSNITFWEKTYQPNIVEPLIRLDYTDAQKKDNGYVVSTNFQTVPLGNNPLNFSLIYKLPTDKQVSISCTVTLNKK